MYSPEGMNGLAGPDELHRLLDAVRAVGSDLDVALVLKHIVEEAAALVDARYAALGILDPTRTRLSDFITAGIDDDLRSAIGDLPSGHGLLGVLIDDPRPLRLPDLAAHPESKGFPPNHPPMTSLLGVPVMIRGVAFGNLYLCDKAGGGAFTEVDEEITVALAAAAAVAIDHARLLTRSAEFALLEDRDRIARDLHDTAIQRLFATGLSLQSLLRVVEQPEVVDRIERAVDELDATVREIRSAIFELHSVRAPGRSTRQSAIELSAESARTLGFEPSIHFDGPVDAALDEERADHLLAVQREALSNVAKHARATAVDLTISSSNGMVSLTLLDDGVGCADDPETGGRGLSNMRDRARMLGGECTIERRDGGGSILRWSVPVS